MNEIPETLKETYTITSADIDFRKKLTPGKLVNIFIQIAWHHAEALNFGIEFMHKNHTVWMLSRLHIKFMKEATWNEQLEVATWPKGINRLFYQRDFEIHNTNQEKIAAGTSEWLIIDIQARRPKLFQADHHIFNPEHVIHAIDSPVPVLSTPEVSGKNFSRTVRYSDIDLNEHLTTTRYIDWMLDTFEAEYLASHSCKELIVNFTREIPQGTPVKIVRHKTNNDNDYLFEFLHPEQDLLFFRGQLSF